MKPNSNLPPGLFLRFFRWFCNPRICDAIEGDLIELYHERISQKGKRKADLHFANDVILLFRPGIIRPMGSNLNLNQPVMFRNYLKVGVRNIVKYKGFSFINIFGLALAMSISMLILMMLADQNRSDSFHEKKDRVYRILSDYDGAKNRYATSPEPIAGVLKADYPGIETATQLIPGVFGDAKAGENIAEMNGYFGDPSFFKLFSFELLEGNPSTALSDPNSVVLSKKLADKLFGTKNPIGQAVEFSDRKGPIVQSEEGSTNSGISWGNFKVTGVIDLDTYPTHFKFEALISSSTLPSLIAEGKVEDKRADWKWFYKSYNFVLLKEGKTVADLQGDLDHLVSQKQAELASEDRKGFKLEAQALSDVAVGFVNNDTKFRMPILGYYFLGILALVIMVSACLNYTNLSIARALTRAKEIGVRKVTGADRKSLLFQFLLESILTSLFALAVALILLLMLVPAFKGLWVNQFLAFQLPFQASLIGWFLLLAIGIGLVAGIYPAIILSGYKPVKALKSLAENSTGKHGFRKVLGVTQFVVSLFFITTSILIYNQFKHFLAFDYGFQTENLVTVSMQGMDYEKLSTEFQRIPGIVAISACDIIPSTGTNNNTQIKLSGKTGEYQSVGLINTDRNFPQNLGLELIAGNAISDSPEALNQVMVNEAMVKELGFESPAELVGQQIESKWGNEIMTVAGVVKDFHFKLLLNEDVISPLLMRYDPASFKYLNVKISSPDPMSTLAALESTWKELDPIHPFEYEFMDAQIEATHLGIFDVVTILGFISFLAIFIACLGLLGMITYTAERKTKEVGIRKFLGAGSMNITFLLGKSFFQLLALSVLIGSPLSYFANNLWLQNFPNRVEFGFGTLALAAFSLLMLGVLTVTSQTFRVARTKVIDTLKMD